MANKVSRAEILQELHLDADAENSGVTTSMHA